MNLDLSSIFFHIPVKRFAMVAFLLAAFMSAFIVSILRLQQVAKKVQLCVLQDGLPA